MFCSDPYDPLDIIEDCKTGRPTLFTCTPWFISMCYDYLRTAGTLAADCPIHLIEFMKIFLCENVSQGYGSVEMCGPAIFYNSGETDNRNLGHTGPPLPHVFLKLEDVVEMKLFTSNKPYRGEILLKSKTTMALGYLDGEPLTKNGDGWFHTGDLGCINPDGTITIIGRREEKKRSNPHECFIISGNHHICLPEIEKTI
eukprot:UN34215